MPNYESFDIAVDGGQLHFARWGQAGPVIMASHGITATHIGFEALADQLALVLGDDFQLIAPDHRGRGKSRGITGPFGMAAHAADVVAVLDHLELERADVLLGHSMGGFVAAVAGAGHPERFASIMLVDGGLPAIDKMPEGVTTEQLVHAVIGPALERLDMRFASPEAYIDFWKAHPAFAAGQWSDYVERYARYDLIGEPPELRASANRDAIMQDIETQLMGDLIPQSLEALTQPTVFMYAPRGILNGPPLYALDAVEGWGQRIANFRLVQVPDVNHYTIVIGQDGAATLAQEISQLVGRAA